MKKGSFILLCLLISLIHNATAQGGYHFGTKGGLSLANQNWNGFERRASLTYHINAFVETLDPEGRGALYAQLGLHNRGSNIGFTSLRNQRSYNFKNISLCAGAKKLLDTNFDLGRPYYFVGIRAEYTLSNNMTEMRDYFLDVFNQNPQFTSPSLLAEPLFATKFNYGLSFGGGIQFDGGDFFTPSLEFTISPDISFQYDRLPNSISSDATQVRNLTFEISFVLRFLREVTYED